MVLLKNLSWKEYALFLIAILAGLALVRTATLQNDAVQEARKAATLNNVAVCRQSQVLIGLSLQNAATAADRARIENLSKLYLAPVNDARRALGLPLCLPVSF